MTIYTFTGSNGDALPSEFSVVDGQIDIQSNKAQANGTPGSALVNAAVVNTGNSDAEQSVIFNAEGSASNGSGLIFRYKDNDNCWGVFLNASTEQLELYKREAGVWTAYLAYSINTFNNTGNYKLAVRFTGDTIIVALNDVDRYTHNSPFLQSETKHGIRLGNTTHSLDDYDDGVLASGDSLTPVTKNYTFQKASNGSASVPVSFNYVGNPVAIEYSVNGGSYQVGDASPSGGQSTFDVIVPVGENTITARFSDDNTVSATLSNIAASFNVAVFGQSNGEGIGNNNQAWSANSNGDEAHLYGNDESFKILADPYDSNAGQVDLISDSPSAAGSYAVRFAHHFLDNKNIPIGLVPTCKGGTPIAEFAKASTVRVDGLNMYESLTKRINAVGGVDLVVFDQGERDSKDGISTPLSTYESALNQLANDIFADFGCKTIVRALQNITAAGYDGNGTTTGQNAIRQAQINAALSNANIEITVANTDIDLSGGDGIHFQTDFDLNLVATRVYDAYSSGSNISTLPLSVTGAGNDTLSIDFYNRGTNQFIETRNVTFSSGSASEIFNVTAGTVIGGFYDGATPPTTGTGIYGITE